ncbi:hypothetical protein HYW72_01610 [Candidatus Nomurabacteria bacterium]|nr:hypothetical protein [Candidatus Nomurabacteria bacterium]
MKRYKNILIPLGSYLIAFVWYLIFMSSSSSFSQFVPYKSGDIMNKVVISVYFLFIIVGLFFGFKSKTKDSSLLNNLVVLIGLLLLIGSFLLYSFSAGWTV